MGGGFVVILQHVDDGGRTSPPPSQQGSHRDSGVGTVENSLCGKENY